MFSWFWKQITGWEHFCWKQYFKIIMIQITISHPKNFEFLCMTFSAYLNQYLFLSFFEWPPLVYTRGLKASRLESLDVWPRNLILNLDLLTLVYVVGKNKLRLNIIILQLWCLADLENFWKKEKELNMLVLIMHKLK